MRVDENLRVGVELKGLGRGSLGIERKVERRRGEQKMAVVVVVVLRSMVVVVDGIG